MRATEQLRRGRLTSLFDGVGPIDRIDPDIPRAEMAYQLLRRQILSAAIPPSTALTELGVAGALGMSRTPVREAFLRLEAENLVAVDDARRRIVVSKPSPNGIEEVLTIRIALDGLAARLAAEFGSSVEIQRLEAVVTTERVMFDGGPKEYMQGDAAFHAALYSAAHNAALARIGMEQRALTIRWAHPRSAHKSRFRQMVREHAEILSAVKARDPDAAAKATEHHLKVTYNAIRARRGRLTGRGN